MVECECWCDIDNDDHICAVECRWVIEWDFGYDTDLDDVDDDDGDNSNDDDLDL